MSVHKPSNKYTGVIRLTHLIRLTTLCCLLLVRPHVMATVLLEMEIDAVANQAELIFEGSVISSEALPDAAGSISTYLTFSITDLIKGDYSEATIELKFLGGTYDGRTMAVAGSLLPQKGEHGIYFVESSTEDLVNPLLGWSQGHFLIQTDASGIEHVATSNGEPVNDIQSVDAIPSSIRKPLTLIGGDGNSASGVIVADDSSNSRPPLSVNEFKTRIRDLIKD